MQRLTTLFRETTRLTDYVDTAAAEKSIRSNIYFRGPNAWILAIAIIIASVGLNVNSIPVIIGAKHATEILKSGAVVTMDGKKGTVSANDKPDDLH